MFFLVGENFVNSSIGTFNLFSFIARKPLIFFQWYSAMFFSWGGCKFASLS